MKITKEKGKGTVSNVKEKKEEEIEKGNVIEIGVIEVCILAMIEDVLGHEKEGKEVVRVLQGEKKGDVVVNGSGNPKWRKLIEDPVIAIATGIISIQHFKINIKLSN